jgi:hypothetical protein
MELLLKNVGLCLIGLIVGWILCDLRNLRKNMQIMASTPPDDWWRSGGSPYPEPENDDE